MKKSVLIGFILFFLVVLCGGIVFASSISQDDTNADIADDEEMIADSVTTETEITEEEMIADWENVIEAAETARCFGPESVLNDNTNIIETADEAAAVFEEYEESLNEILTEKQKEVCLGLYETYPEDIEMREDVMADPDAYFLEVVDFGHFDIEILDYEIVGDTVSIIVSVTNWEKVITSDTSGFSVLFPVNKCIEAVQMVFEEGVWKHDGWEIKSALLMEGDYDLEQTFATYEEAVAYAHSVMPKNVLADVTVKPER